MKREEAIQWLETIDALGIDDGAGSIVIALKMAIDALQSQKTGRWAYKTTDAYIQRTCSACGWSERMYHRNRNQDGLIRNYCPNCGAHMEKESRNERQNTDNI